MDMTGTKKLFTQLLRIKSFKLGFIMLLIMLSFAAIFSYLSPSHYLYWYVYPKNVPPSFSKIDYILGTTANGRAVIWSLAHGIINSLIIGFTVAMVTAHLGLFLGMISGFRGGTADKIITTVTDAFIVIPSLPLYIVVIMVLRGVILSLGNPIPFIGLIFSINGWCWPTRQVRAMVLSLREREFIYTASLSGYTTLKIIIKEILPHLIPWHFINFTNAVLYGISNEAGLAILGLSILDKDTLGTIIYWALYHSALLRGLWWWYLAPILTVIILFLALFLVAHGVTMFVNPKLRSVSMTT